MQIQDLTYINASREPIEVRAAQRGRNSFRLKLSSVVDYLSTNEGTVTNFKPFSTTIILVRNWNYSPSLYSFKKVVSWWTVDSEAFVGVTAYFINTVPKRTLDKISRSWRSSNSFFLRTRCLRAVEKSMAAAVLKLVNDDYTLVKCFVVMTNVIR